MKPGTYEKRGGLGGGFRLGRAGFRLLGEGRGSEEDDYEGHQNGSENTFHDAPPLRMRITCALPKKNAAERCRWVT
jgi:hypothetical protein